MQYRELGKSGIKASIVGLGTWAFGGGTVWGHNLLTSEIVETIHTALDSGINLIDTAPLFGFGHCEEILAEILDLRRDDVILATRCGIVWEDNEDNVQYGHYEGKPIHLSLTPQTIRLQIEASLRRLKTEFIDVYQAHWKAGLPTTCAIEDIIGTLEDFKSSGLIRAYGFSNINLDQAHNWLPIGHFDLIQNRFSMLNREMEQDLMPWAAENNVSIMACMPLYQGLLTGRINHKQQFGPHELRSNYAINPWFKKENRIAIHKKLLQKWIPIAEHYHCSIAQLVIAWTIAQNGLTHAICGATNPKQARENAAAGLLKISDEDLEQMIWDIEVVGDPQ